MGKMINCGANGCIFRSSPGSVLKIIDEFEEANLAAWLVGRKLAYFPKIYQVFEIDVSSRFAHLAVSFTRFRARSRLPKSAGLPFGFKFYIIWREEIPSLKLSDRKTQEFGELVENLEIISLSKKSIDALGPPKKLVGKNEITNYQSWKSEIRERMADLKRVRYSPTISKLKPQIIKCFQWMLDSGIYISDLANPNNWGWKRNRLIIRDFGLIYDGLEEEMKITKLE